MHQLARVLMVLLIMNLQGCQSFNKYIPTSLIQDAAKNQQQSNDLFLQGIQYQKLNKKEQQITCQSLKQQYQSHPQWQTAWLLVYTANSNFNCLSLNKTKALINKLQNIPDMTAQLLWLNTNQVQVIKKFQKLKNNNHHLQSKLTITEKKLQLVTSKIQALKKIEAHINKKLDHE